MGSRAQYIVMEKGDWSLHRSHWGAGALMVDLAYGPAAATRCFRSCHRMDDALRHIAEGWLDDVWCEGAALVDHDRQLLLWFVNMGDEWAERAAHRAILARTWPGWEIRWAHDGTGDLLVQLGLDRRLLREPPATQKAQGYWAPPEGDEAISLLMTVRQPDGTVGAWGASFTGAYEQLQGGQGLLGVLPADMPPPNMDAMPDGGIHFDPATHTLSLWTTDLAIGLHDWPVPGWEGWELKFWGEDHRKHAALAAECVRFPHLDLAPILTDWLQRIGEPAPFPAAALALAMTPPAGTDLVPVVHPEATVPHASPTPTAAETRALRTVIAELLTGANPGDLPR
jgi:hypothetical protein